MTGYFDNYCLTVNLKKAKIIVFCNIKKNPSSSIKSCNRARDITYIPRNCVYLPMFSLDAENPKLPS